jgi:hypothetical protein
MVVTPAATPEASPFRTLATFLLDDLHDMEGVISLVLPSEKVPVALKCCVVPIAIEGLRGVISILVRVGRKDEAGKPSVTIKPNITNIKISTGDCFFMRTLLFLKNFCRVSLSIYSVLPFSLFSPPSLCPFYEGGGR